MNAMLEKISALASVRETDRTCTCGTVHTLATDTVELSGEATEKMLGYLGAYKNPAVVCDENTAKFARRLPFRTVTLPAGCHADEKSVAALSEALGGEDVLIACGSGSVHDITRYVAFERSLPFVSYPTAASVDGFVSGVAAMTWHGQKLTFPSAAPVAVFADTAVFTDAPRELLASGVGDMLGKLIALTDWRVASILTGETVCEKIYAAEAEALGMIISAINGGDVSAPEFARSVMEALILSGLAMQLCGHSRPASGAEHHISHLWEMHLINGETDALHGEKVGAGAVLAASAYKNALKNGLPDRIRPLGDIFSRDKLYADLGAMTDGLLRENLPDGTLSSSSLNKLTLTGDRLDAAAAELEKLPTSEKISELLERAGAKRAPAELGLPGDELFIEKTLKYAPYVRNRFTLLKLLSAAY